MSRDLHIELAETPEARRLPWEAMEAEGVTKVILWNRLEPSILDWLDMVDPTKCILLNVWDVTSGEYIGATWITPLLGYAACTHFFIREPFRPEAVELGRFVVGDMLERMHLSCLWGFTPAPYRHVFGFLRGLGFKALGRLPKACNMPTEANPTRHVDAVITRLTPDGFVLAGER